MSVLKKNIAANYAGSIWSALMSFLFIPLYIKYMGIDYYGLIGVFVTMQAVFSILDMGISSTLNRELARLSTYDSNAVYMRNLVRTLEVIYWLIGLTIAVIIISSSSFIAVYWITSENVSATVIQQSILLMGISVFFQFPASLYTGGLMGLQHQVILNIINIFMATFKGLGVVFILIYISPTIYAFLIWQIAMNFLQSIVLHITVWKKLPKSDQRTIFDKTILINIWRFAAGISGISILAIILTQVDKVILSKILNLANFGYYTLASTVAIGISRLTSPVFSATYPKFSELVTINNQEKIKQIYHRSCQLVSVIIIPVSLTIAFFS